MEIEGRDSGRIGVAAGERESGEWEQNGKEGGGGVGCQLCVLGKERSQEGNRNIKFSCFFISSKWAIQETGDLLVLRHVCGFSRMIHNIWVLLVREDATVSYLGYMEYKRLSSESKDRGAHLGSSKARRTKKDLIKGLCLEMMGFRRIQKEKVLEWRLRDELQNNEALTVLEPQNGDSALARGLS
ncbi:hypothetical protein ACH5RR_012732 [Cinchona calisaya]|uniref:Uncharacterized protein n=1 Tax=Cinchona calisaya TaxID=153742 RepID=A0ABD3A8G0_9GENT